MVPPTANRCHQLPPGISEKRADAMPTEQWKLQLLGASFAKLWPVDETPCFEDVLLTIDVKDRRPDSRRA